MPVRPSPAWGEALEARQLLSAIPSLWSQADIGTVGKGGGATNNNGLVTVSGGGADIWGETDAFHYVYSPLTGNGGITAQVTAVQNTNGWAKAGVMLRETTASDSRFVLLVVTPSNGISFQVRSATHIVPTYITTPGGAGEYLTLTRTGNTIAATISTDGKTWKSAGSVTMTLANTVEVGLAVTAHDNAKLNTSSFSHVAINTTSAAASAWSVGTPDYLQRWESDTAVVGGKMYVFGGYINRALNATTESDAYTPATNSWAHLAAEPYAVTHAGTVAVGTTIYLAGGYLGQQTNNPPMTNVVQAYSTTTNTWSLLPALPAQVAAGGLAYVGHSLYFFGGIEPGRTVDSAKTWALDLNNTGAGWVAKANMPDARNHIGYTTLNGLVYAIGGLHLTNERSGQDAEVDVYNPATNAWSRAASLPMPWSHFNDSTLVVNGKIVIVGGQADGPTGDGIYLANIAEFNPSTNRWAALAPLPEARQAVAGGYVNGTLVVIDGAIDADAGGWPQQQVWLYKNFTA